MHTAVFILIISRGDDFRTAFAMIGELRSIIPDCVRILALTATATHSTLQAVKDRLSLQDPVIVGLSPNRPNIFLSVLPTMKLDELIEMVAGELLEKKVNYPKTVIFCRTYQDCTDLYSRMVRYLGDDKTEPPGYPDLLQFRLLTMYTRASTVAMKQAVLSVFTKQGSKLRIVIATTSFSMGIDCPDVHQIIHWRPPSDLEQYLQEIGRAGRDRELSRAILICGKKGRHMQQSMKAYYENNQSCRRCTLFRSFILFDDSDRVKCKCCDICSKSCNCEECSKQ